MRWLLLKDLQILRRSPLLVGLLVAYPVLISVLMGFALSKGPDKPMVAFANLVPPGEGQFTLGSERLDASQYANRLFRAIEPLRVRTREEAIDAVRDGRALGALVVPADVVTKLQSAINLSAGSSGPPTLEVYYNAEDPLKRQFVESTIESQLAEANKALTERLTTTAAGYLGILLRGGDFEIFGRRIDVLGLRRSETVLEATIAGLPDGAPERGALEQVRRFAQLAGDNLDLSDEILASVGEPVRVKQTVVEGARTPLDAYAAAIAVTISLMLLGLLLAAGMLALEREENAFARLVRGPVSRLGLLAEKIGLSALCAAAVALLMLAGLGAFIGFDYARAPLWVLAAGAGALAFAAMGVAIGGLAREVRAASLLAVLLSLPVAFLALVPEGSVSDALYAVVSALSAIFPFKPTLEALDRAVNGGESLAGPLLHLLALAAGFTALARLGLRRFAH